MRGSGSSTPELHVYIEAERMVRPVTKAKVTSLVNHIEMLEQMLVDAGVKVPEDGTTREPQPRTDSTQSQQPTAASNPMPRQLPGVALPALHGAVPIAHAAVTLVQQFVPRHVVLADVPLD